MRRSASESSFCDTPFWGMHVPPLQASVNAATPIDVGPTNVAFAGVTKSGWNFQVASVVLVAPIPTSRFGSPIGGGVVPSRSAGRRPPNAVLVMKHSCDADAPASIAARSIAQACAPR
jgi:hypothetical protein